MLDNKVSQILSESINLDEIQTKAARIQGSDAALFARIREINDQMLVNSMAQFDAACYELCVDMEAARDALRTERVA